MCSLATIWVTFWWLDHLRGLRCRKGGSWEAVAVEILNQNGSQGALWEPVGATIAPKSAKSDPLSGSGKEKAIK